VCSIFKIAGDEDFPVLFLLRFKRYNIMPLITPSLCSSQVLPIFLRVAGIGGSRYIIIPLPEWAMMHAEKGCDAHAENHFNAVGIKSEQF
jgi:hypothetical protein